VQERRVAVPEFAWVVGAVVGLLVCCILARVASDGRSSAWWGLLGPLGVIVAGFRGVHARLAAPPEEPAKAPAPAYSETCAECGADLLLRGRMAEPHLKGCSKAKAT
jgi:hypothetical protein